MQFLRSFVVFAAHWIRYDIILINVYISFKCLNLVNIVISVVYVISIDSTCFPLSYRNINLVHFLFQVKAVFAITIAVIGLLLLALLNIPSYFDTDVNIFIF